ncbi:MAG TPA: cysteine desulfurase [Chloroflexi bacterium]|nr:cysteine desulfurase [Chloroflexota bacterium]
MPEKPVYLDYNATTPVDAEAVAAMLPYLSERFGNPSSAHPYGREARQAVERARAQVADLLGCQPEEIVFTGGGTESNNTVIKGVAEAYREQGKHIITTAIEHPAVLEPCEWLATRGYQVTILPVDEHGRLTPATLEKALMPGTILVSVMLANNEIGTIQPLAEVARLAHARGALVHTDAAQATGKIPVDVKALGVDFLSVAGHKLYAPKGVGALYIREGLRLPKFMHGASHEANRRAGTENVPGIVALGQAAEVARRDLSENMAHMRAMRDRLWEGLSARIPDIRRNGHTEHGLPNTLSVSFRNVEANALLERISDRVAASAGAACHADEVSVSAVLQAIGLPLEYAMGTLRLSVGKMTTPQEIDTAVAALVEAVGELRTASPPSFTL